MTSQPRSHIGSILLATLVFVTSVAAGGRSVARADGFPRLSSWVLVGAYQDSSNIGNEYLRCVGSFGPRPDSLRRQPRTLSVRWLRDRRAEARPDFGGYRLYRMVNTSRPDGGPDSTHAELIRRFSVNTGSEMTWNFSRLDTVAFDVRIDSTHTNIGGRDTTIYDTTTTPHANYMQYVCGGEVVHDSVVTFVDSDSSGNFLKVCRRRSPSGVCLSPRDSVFILQAPPGPHDGTRTWYSITYEELNTTDTNYQDLFVPDTLGTLGPCDTIGVRNSCRNLNNKLANAVGPVEPTGGPTLNLERVRVVPNPYRGHESWDPVGGSEIHFTSLPKQARILIYTVSGDLVQELHHSDAVRDFERWDLKSSNGHDVASGIYIFRIEAAGYSFQNRFVVIR
jgi:hypothetical protein